ncbi:MAG TPA: VWA domain-containing protein, partial [Tepidisphaeraceae bacterium]|nr:VWA domain-containing protein [Tepidisphaeraceae bacterium]
FALTLTAGEDLAGAAPKGADYVFVLDISGSMNDDAKLDLSRNSLAAFVKALGAEDRFEVMAFNVQPRPLFKQMTAVNEASQAQAAQFLAEQRAAGGTVLLPAMQAAYRYADKDRPLNVILLSDGMTEQQERATLISAIRARPTGARVFCIGVGNDVNRGLLEQMANDSGGLAAFLSREDNFDRQAQAFRRKLTKPVATDVKIEVAGVGAFDVEPQVAPSLYFGAPLKLYGRYKQPGTAKVTLTGQVAGQALTRTVEIEFPREDKANPQIERMWAYNRVQRLLKEADAGAGRAGVTDEIVRLGEGYSIVTEYTSFLVLENDAEFARWKIERRNARRMERDRASGDALAADLERMRNKARADIGPEAVVSPKLASAASTPTPAGSPVGASPQASTPVAQDAPAGRRQNQDLFPRRGGGAIDPVSGGIVLGLAGLLTAGAMKRRRAA